jgi:hypothetical protein
MTRIAACPAAGKCGQVGDAREVLRANMAARGGTPLWHMTRTAWPAALTRFPGRRSVL